MTSIWDNQRNCLPAFLFLPIWVRVLQSLPLLLYFYCLQSDYWSHIPNSHKIAPSIPSQWDHCWIFNRGSRAPPASQVMPGSILGIFSIVLHLFGSRGAYSTDVGLRNGRECCFTISFHFCFSSIIAAEIFHIGCGFFDYYNAVTKLLPLHFSG